ncbi:SDR family NAD(P)-dependent oxidoreductase [Carboxylicivirga mesophila]|uniref:SDR family NAD(P)-dependent oxidoreductase n=1 Tax=Carboxylicivirga mesophila TaxID=1166478 RepID=A0ABS5KBB6_9BACT|nr:SDR family NAD(P)-dependent oxidoreductase [Carboxylicivirga mesophila]MBS2212275.1 SDR family NAD(P)-dependent oxidoreductase [Carboxylicivirga mesophila]
MHILITGTSSGIGHGLAQEFLARGAKVWGISRRIADDLNGEANFHHIQLDLTNHAALLQQLPAFISDTKRFDMVILNAGVLGPVKWMSEVDIVAMQQVMDTNLWSNKVLLDLLFELGKDIRQVVGMSSKASLRSTPGWGPYSLSKAALNMLMNIYAKEHTSTHFIAFAPGLVDSEIQETIWNIKATDKYPAVKRLQEARYTEDMPDSRAAASNLIRGIEKCRELESGSFADVREL